MYDSDTSTVTDALKGSSTAVFTDDTISKILALTTTDTDTTIGISQTTTLFGGDVTIPSGTDLAYVTPLSNAQINVQGHAPVVVFSGLLGANATFNDTVASGSEAGHTDRVVVGSAGADKIVIADNHNTQITIGANDTVFAGTGADTVVATGGNSTIVGASHGQTIVQLGGNASDYTVTVNNGHAVVVTGGTTVDTTGIKVVSDAVGSTLLIADTAGEAAVNSIYYAAYGHGADATTLATMVRQYNDGTTLSTLAHQVAGTTAFHTATDSMDDSAFVQALYQNTFGRAAEDAGLAYWVDALTHGSSRGDLLTYFSQIGGYSRANLLEHNEAQVIGSVTIVHNIV